MRLSYHLIELYHINVSVLPAVLILFYQNNFLNTEYYESMRLSYHLIQLYHINVSVLPAVLILF